MSSNIHWKRFLVIGVINILAVVILFAAAEFLYRRYVITHTIFESVRDVEFDEWLGWVPKPGIYGPHVITPDHFRKTEPDNFSRSGKKVLICGDSFTYCCGVLDNETWPYYLSEYTGWQITNAGVSGYGLDQTILRMEKVIDDILPEIVIISMIADDVSRCELSKRTHFKPYYSIVNGEPVLCNHPVPSPADSPEEHRWYEKSLIIRHLIGVFSEGCRQIQNNVREHNNGMLIARYLCSLAKNITRRYNAELVMVIQPAHAFPGEKESHKAAEIEKMIRSLNIPILNLFPLLEQDFTGRNAMRRALFVDHMDAPGNKWVAEKVVEFISRIANSFLKGDGLDENIEGDVD